MTRHRGALVNERQYLVRPRYSCYDANLQAVRSQYRDVSIYDVGIFVVLLRVGASYDRGDLPLASCRGELQRSNSDGIDCVDLEVQVPTRCVGAVCPVVELPCTSREGGLSGNPRHTHVAVDACSNCVFG